MYKLIATISIILRQYFIPNPFEALGDGMMITLEGSQILLSPEILNWIAEPIIFTLTFGIVGLYYERGSAPALGSLLYLLFYCVHTFILWILSVLGFEEWAIIVVVILYIGCHVILKRLRECFV